MRKLLRLITVLLLFTVNGCNSDQTSFEFSDQGRDVPLFSSENAYRFIEEQVAFGPRVPNSPGHRNTILYLNDFFREKAGNRGVYIQSFQTEVYGDTLNLYNLIASFAPQNPDRIVLAAHWDTRPMAELDPQDPDSPIQGADDGGSGVGVLMELASIFALSEPPIGVDIILFDGEDYGKPSDLDNYFLGSRHWGANPPVPGYNPRFGILLDMVGGTGATFPKERYSMRFAPDLVNEIWRIAEEFGYEELFLDEMGGFIQDDHIIVERLTGIPMINIIHHRVDALGTVHFPFYWHTHEDTMEIIDQNVLQAVGEVLLELIYNRIPS